MPTLEDVLADLLALGATEVWLYGSRANDRARPGSDWELLVHAPLAARQALAEQEPWDGFHILVGDDGETFVSPWNAPNQLDSVTLSFLRWQRLSESTARNEGTYVTTPRLGAMAVRQRMSWEGPSSDHSF